MKKLTEKELTNLQSLQQEFNRAKLELGNTVLQQSKLMETVSEIKTKFSAEEEVLMKKYGKDVTINLESGEITDKVEESDESPKLNKVESE